MLNKPTVAVLLASYNGERFIKEQIETIENQDEVISHIFVSDDCSDDATIRIVSELKHIYENITILSEIVKFGSAAANFFHLIMRAPTEGYDFYALSDQDDVWLSSKLFSAINALTANSAAGYSSSVDAWWSNQRIRHVKKNHPQKIYDYFFEGPGPGCTFVLKRELFLRLREFISNNQNAIKNIYYHDWFIYAFSRSRDYRWFIDGLSYIHYRQHKNNDTGANIGLRSLSSRLKKIWGFWARDQVYEIASVLGYSKILISYFSGSCASFLRLLKSFFQFRRSTIDCFVLLILGLAGRFRPPQRQVK